MSPMSPMSLKRLSPWAIHTGFGSEVVQFVDNTGPSPPRPGTSTSLILRRPFRARRDEQFWAVFETAAACDNGYLGWPEGAAQLASLRFVRCRLFEDAAPADEVARGAEILAVLGPEDLLALPPADEAILSWLYKPQVVTHGRLCYVNSNIECCAAIKVRTPDNQDEKVFCRLRRREGKARPEAQAAECLA